MISPPLRMRFWRYVFHLPFMDRMLRRRAADLLDKAGMDAHLNDATMYADIGSGSGHMLEEVLERTSRRPNLKCLGIDPFWRPILQVRRRLKQTFGGRHEFVRSGGENMPLLAGAVDVASLCFILHHVAHDLQAKIVAEAYRVLKPGGVLFLFEDTPATKRQWRRVERWDRISNFEPPWEKHYYRSIREWAAYLLAAGFQLIETIEFDRMIPQMGMAPVPHCCLLLRKGT